MALSDFIQQLEELEQAAVRAFESAADADGLEAARIEFLGAKSGRLKEAQKGLGQVPPADKPQAGKRFNQAKTTIEAAFEAAKSRTAAAPKTPAPKVKAAAADQAPPSIPGKFDPTETPPAKRRRIGRLHPITQTILELQEIMGRLGFTVAEGPEVEDEWHNFEALNIPADHVARDPLENFYLATAEAAGGARLLRSQTSTVQIRVMEQQPPPVRIISLGRVYRPDTPDDTHYPMFHQIEGLLVDKHVTMADLKSVLRMFAESYFGGEVHIRFRPSFFPFTEPSVEVDMAWNDRWIEMGGAGMVDPHVLAAVGYDPDQVSGFAFGLGVERICMRRHNITDIREFYKNDVRFLRQF